ncbi:MAG: nucleotidyl transferase AbiEii/AbiGii toxin family protein [Patescibacteria group bacterium]
MILPHPKEAVHKAWLYRILIHLYDDNALSAALYFKGGTCAAMLGYLDRFSVDLDFDFMLPREEIDATRKKMEKIFTSLGLEIKDKSQNTLQYFLKYSAAAHARNTIKIDATFPPVRSNQYQAFRLPEIDRIVTCQTIETMFANKLVAPLDRYEKNESVAGRDVYDIHYFFLQGYRYNHAVIEERRHTDLPAFFQELIKFTDTHVNETTITQDLNFLVPYDKFRTLRKCLKNEVLMFLKDELKRLTH